MQSLALVGVDDRLIGRRQSIRHPMDLSARVIASGANLRVQLDDISTHGACLRLMHPRRLTEGRLCWLRFEAYGRVAWQHELRCGLIFEDPLSDECLRQTVEFGELAVGEASEKYLKLASAWVHGPGDW